MSIRLTFTILLVSLVSFGLNFQISNISNSQQVLSRSFQNLLENVGPIEQKLNQTFIEFVNSLNLTDACHSTIFRWTQALSSGQLWAIRMLDAFEGIPTGLTNGVITSFGEYDLCLNVKSDDQVDASDNRPVVHGKYCLIRPYIDVSDGIAVENIDMFSLLNNETQSHLISLSQTNRNKLKILMTMAGMNDKFYMMHIGICVPSQCSITDINNIYGKGKNVWEFP